jgi:hypothetical protein
MNLQTGGARAAPVSLRRGRLQCRSPFHAGFQQSDRTITEPRRRETLAGGKASIASSLVGATALRSQTGRKGDKEGGSDVPQTIRQGRVEGKVAIVTGAGLNERGLNIGGATAQILAREGARVLIATRTEKDGEALADSIRGAGGQALACGLDQGDEQSIRNMIDLTVNTFGRIDILINNAVAVLPEDTDVERTPIEIWDRTMQVNPRGVFLTSKFALPHMLARGGGSIVNISSGSGVAGDNVRVAY